MSAILGIIPARYASQRLPGKPLASIEGISMIERVYRQVEACSQLDRLVVATDDPRILDHVNSFGGEAQMTSPEHPSGTDRCAEIVQKIEGDYSVILNIQGDLPFLPTEMISRLIACFEDGQAQIATLARPIEQVSELRDDTLAKIALSTEQDALYFSRGPVPYLRDIPSEDWLNHASYYKHIGIYGFRKSVLEHVTQLPPSPLEKAEKLEQLRWLSHYRIRVGLVQLDTLSVDTPEDLQKAQAWARQHTKG